MTPEVPGPPSGPVSGGAPGRAFGRSLPFILVGMLFLGILVSHEPDRNEGIVDLLTGPDDAMRLVQVVDWLDGQGWSDVTQRRLDPPEGVAMHWSRLADLPLAAAMRLTEPWVGRDRALYLAVRHVPPILGMLFAAAFLWTMTTLVPGGRAHVPIVMVATPVFPLLQFLPGRVDHHGLQLVLITLGVGLLARAVGPSGLRAAAVLGIVCGVSLGIGLESLPFVIGAATSLGLTAMLRGGGAGAALALFGLAATGTVLAVLFLTVSGPGWAAIVCDRASLVHAAVAAIVLVAGGGAVALERLGPAATRTARLTVIGGIGVAGLAAVAIAFPECAGSPYANLDPDVRYWFDKVRETQSILDLFPTEPGPAVSIVILPVAALALLAVRRSDFDEGAADPRRIALVVLVLSSLALVVWQVRGVWYAALVASLALVPFAATVARAGRHRSIPARLGLKLCVPAICIAAIIVPQRLTQSAPDDAGREDSACEPQSVVASLADLGEAGTPATIIAAPIDLGPAILLLTAHKVLAAPYHRNVRGLADHRRIFAGIEEEALAAIRSRGVGAVVFCSKYTHVTPYSGRTAFLNERLGANRPPWWLNTVARSEYFGLYAVHPAVRGQRR